MTPLSGQQIMTCSSIQIILKKRLCSLPERRQRPPSVTIGGRGWARSRSGSAPSRCWAWLYPVTSPGPSIYSTSAPKQASGFYFLCMLRRAGASRTDMLDFYKSTICASVECACPVWHTGLTVEQSDSVGATQKRAMKIIYQDMAYAEALGAAGLECLDARRERLARPFFLQIFSPHHKLNRLFPETRIIEYGLRRTNIYPLPTVRTF